MISNPFGLQQQHPERVYLVLADQEEEEKNLLPSLARSWRHILRERLSRKREQQQQARLPNAVDATHAVTKHYPRLRAEEVAGQEVSLPGGDKADAFVYYFRPSCRSDGSTL